MKYRSQKVLGLLKNWEGVREKMYVDPAGYPSIGIGHKLTEQELKTGLIIIVGTPHPWRKGLSMPLIEALEDQDNDFAEAVVNEHVKVPLTQDQFDALFSFAFNVGAKQFIDSTLLKKLNAKDYAAVPTQLRRWVYRKDKKTGKRVVDKGLSNRREAEIKLWNGLI